MRDWKFGVSWGLLGVCVFCAVAGFVVSVANYKTKASKSAVAAIQKKLNPGELEAFKDACASQVQGAAASGVVLIECKLLSPKVTKKPNPNLVGDHAEVDLLVKDSNGQHYAMFVQLDKSTYTTVGQNVTPIEGVLRTIPAP